MKLIIIRHGETEENVAGVLQGHQPGVLSQRGHEQVKRVGHRLKDERIDFIYSSDLARAVDTAREIARYHPTIPWVQTRDIRERHLGENQGKTRTELGLNQPGAQYVDAPSGETRAHVLERARSVLDGLAKKHGNMTVLLVGHGSINRALIMALVGEEPVKGKRMRNTGVTIIEMENGETRLVLLDCIRHLEDGNE